jgi:HSP20 family protein
LLRVLAPYRAFHARQLRKIRTVNSAQNLYTDMEAYMAEAQRRPRSDEAKSGEAKFRPPHTEELHGENQNREDAAGKAGLWDHPIESLRREWDRAVESFPARWPFGGTRLENEPFWRRQLASHNEPALDVAERDDKYEIFIELPGIEEKDIQLKLANGVLVVRGEKHGEHEERRKDYVLSERTYGTFQRSLRAPEGVDLDRVEASFENGVLTVTLPKTSEARRREKRIPIKSARKD